MKDTRSANAHARDRTISTASSVASSRSNNSDHSNSYAGNTAGIQLLSPTFQRSMRAAATRHTVVRPLPTSKPAATTTSSRVTTSKGIEFDFNSFTLESVRSSTLHSNNNSSHSSHSSSCHSSSRTAPPLTQRRPHTATSDYSASSSGLSSHAELLADAASPHGTSSFHTMRSTEDFDAAAAGARTALPPPPPPISAPAAIERIHTASRTAPSSRSRTKPTIRLMGWLQKRKGVALLKRWKSYYCLLRDDDHLCLYASEDTINGRVEQRVHILRVVLTAAQSDVFYVIGVHADGSPRRIELRAGHSVDARRWCYALRPLLDAASLAIAVTRTPELMLVDASARSFVNGSMSYNDDACGYDTDENNSTTSSSDSYSGWQRPRHNGSRSGRAAAAAVAPASLPTSVLPRKQQPNQQRALAGAKCESYDAFNDELLASRSVMSNRSTLSGVSSSWTHLLHSNSGAECPVMKVRDASHNVPILGRHSDDQSDEDYVMDDDDDGCSSSRPSNQSHRDSDGVTLYAW